MAIFFFFSLSSLALCPGGSCIPPQLQLPHTPPIPGSNPFSTLSSSTMCLGLPFWETGQGGEIHADGSLSGTLQKGCKNRWKSGWPEGEAILKCSLVASVKAPESLKVWDSSSELCQTESRGLSFRMSGSGRHQAQLPQVEV